MPKPLFIIYELLFRMHQLDPSVGAYTSHSFNTTGAKIQTTGRTLRVKKSLLNKQFKDPKLISDEDLLQILQAPAVKSRQRISV